MIEQTKKASRSIAGSLLLAIVVASCGGGAEPSDALAVAIDPAKDKVVEDQVVGFLDFTNGTKKTFGVFVCARAGEVVLESVEAIELEGEIELLGSLLYKATDEYVGAIDGYPPTGLDDGTLTGIEGGIVSNDCDDSDTDPRTQILVGANRVGSTGGTIKGIRIIHDDGFLDVPDYTIILCGDDYEYCEEYAPET